MKDLPLKTPMSHNPFREKAIGARALADRLSGQSSHEKAMESAFPLGAGFGHGSARSREKSMDASITRAGKAVKAIREAERLELIALLFDGGTIDTQGRARGSAASIAKADKRHTAQEKRKARIAAAKAEMEGRDPLDVTPETYADACGSLGGSGRKLLIWEHTQRRAEKAGKK